MDLRALRDAAAIEDPVERAWAISRLMTENQGLVAEAAKGRRHAIAEARERGVRGEEIAGRLGVTPGGVSKMGRGPTAGAPEPPVLVQRPLPTEPAVRGSLSLFLTEAE